MVFLFVPLTEAVLPDALTCFPVHHSITHYLVTAKGQIALGAVYCRKDGKAGSIILPRLPALPAKTPQRPLISFTTKSKAMPTVFQQFDFPLATGYEPKDPVEVIQSFYSDFSLTDLKDELGELLHCYLTINNSNEQTGRDRSDRIFFCVRAWYLFQALGMIKNAIQCNHQSK